MIFHLYMSIIRSQKLCSKVNNITSICGEYDRAWANCKRPKSQQVEWFELTAMLGGYAPSIRRSRPTLRSPMPNPCPPPGQPHQQPSPTRESKIQTESSIRHPVPARSQPNRIDGASNDSGGGGRDLIMLITIPIHISVGQKMKRKQ